MGSQCRKESNTSLEKRMLREATVWIQRAKTGQFSSWSQVFFFLPADHYALMSPNILSGLSQRSFQVMYHSCLDFVSLRFSDWTLWRWNNSSLSLEREWDSGERSEITAIIVNTQMTKLQLQHVPHFIAKKKHREWKKTSCLFFYCNY